MSVSAVFSGSQFYFEDYPSASLAYKEEGLEGEVKSFQVLSVEDSQSKRILSVFVKADDLRRAGFSIKAWNDVCNCSEKIAQLVQNTAKCRGFLEKALDTVSRHLSLSNSQRFRDEMPLINASINYAFASRLPCLKKNPKTPGMYFDYEEAIPKVFINLKKTKYLGRGSFAKVRKILWLNSPGDESQVIAKKVLLDKDKESIESFKTEIAALRTFSGKRGIISFIAGGEYEDKWNIFMSIYECNAHEYVYGTYRLSTEKELDVAMQWLEGLSHISEKGIHGDIKLGNLLLRRSVQGELEAVIADFGTYRAYGEEQFGLTTEIQGSPEYYRDKAVSRTHDVWTMGLCLYGFFSRKDPIPKGINLGSRPEDSIQRLDQMQQWTSTLSSNWIMEGFEGLITPVFVKSQISLMLEPDQNRRINAKDSFESFSADHSSFLNETSRK